MFFGGRSSLPRARARAHAHTHTHTHTHTHAHAHTNTHTHTPPPPPPPPPPPAASVCPEFTGRPVSAAAGYVPAVVSVAPHLADLGLRAVRQVVGSQAVLLARAVLRVYVPGTRTRGWLHLSIFG